MMKMYGYLPAWGCSDMSPFVSFTDAYLRMAGIPFKAEILYRGDLTATPKGKLPYIEQDNLFKQYRFDLAYNNSANAAVGANVGVEVR